ncbi:L,D-transpeptidase family protein [Chryseobacterium salivictor]|uniref:L,D-TPase catalytic domain-containing protein n=1 Tax=Chryseobacterium salivictor TaxID=2547600 RepID=A0A4P6ZHR4_9FLAO|nr:L,D-transpeptidase family protein [Chryseobacterium salivictor]QBO59330.1 hypothetical protein NBC122_02526 [Chryseobacterium salivictor]
MKAILYFHVILLAVIQISGQNIRLDLFLADTANWRTLHYPKTVKRFYEQNGFKYAWMDSEKDLLQGAVALLASAPQYGMSSYANQPQEFSAEKLKKAAHPTTAKDSVAMIRNDILITDQLITFLNHLHFGKYNPFYKADEIDERNIDGFRADEILAGALRKRNLQNAASEAQPKIKAYQDLQNYLRRTFSGDNEVPPETVTKIIINMERLRWVDTDEDSYILVNIPSYTLEFHQAGKISEFKVIVGKPSNKSPVLKSAIHYFTTAPVWVVPQSIMMKEILPKILKNRQYLTNHHYSFYNKEGHPIKGNSTTLKAVRSNPSQFTVRQSAGPGNALGAIVFRFPNPYHVYLHDTSQPNLFHQEYRALSHGCIRVEDAKQLAGLLLTGDGAANQIPELEEAMQTYTRKDFILKKPVPFMISYLTCRIHQGKPEMFRDIYGLDKNLEQKFPN